jgi:hypothetical protein
VLDTEFAHPRVHRGAAPAGYDRYCYACSVQLLDAVAVANVEGLE